MGFLEVSKCEKLLSMLKYSLLRRFPMNYEKNGFGCITLNVVGGRRSPAVA